jgi:hypothetical protein
MATLTLNNEDGAAAHFNLCLNAGNKMFQMIETDAASNQPGFGLAQGTVTCGLTGIKKSFTTNIVGLTGSNLADTVGRLTLDGKGNISGAEVLTNNGAISTDTVTGTYTERHELPGYLAGDAQRGLDAKLQHGQGQRREATAAD